MDLSYEIQPSSCEIYRYTKTPQIDNDLLHLDIFRLSFDSPMPNPIPVNIRLSYPIGYFKLYSLAL